ncbi:MAG: M23 family metallopeptidase [Actinomycetota bacterium]|nr:M23 family metallopeptidase [Actinomycetota bacterium]
MNARAVLAAQRGRLLLVTMFILAASTAQSVILPGQAEAHTVVWNPATYTTPVTNPCRAVSQWYGTSFDGSRSHNVNDGNYRGIDIAVPTGTAVYAPKAGRVVFSGWNTGGGNMISIDHVESGGTLRTVLAHLNSRLVGTGSWVEKNQLIGYSGATGQVTGPHLHWHMIVSDHGTAAYSAVLDDIPGVMERWSPRKICGTEGGG